LLETGGGVSEGSVKAWKGAVGGVGERGKAVVETKRVIRGGKDYSLEFATLLCNYK
jgi:hypothetical protein